uniref:galactose mutarotase-like n=1 Tax=Centroberyx gerrardi TaxID=166262 RepID=UPI003AAA69AE
MHRDGAASALAIIHGNDLIPRRAGRIAVNSPNQAYVTRHTRSEYPATENTEETRQSHTGEPLPASFSDAQRPINKQINLSLSTGEVRSVEGTPFDLRNPVLIGPRLKEVPGPGFDHNFCLASPGDPWAERHTARVCHPASGHVLEVSTSQPGVQFYTANFLDGSVAGKDGTVYRKHSSFCLETQNWPDAVNQASFPDSLLRPGEEYRHVTRFTFTTV